MKSYTTTNHLSAPRAIESNTSEFISFFLSCRVISFSEFELKSGRPSPYFFNSGALNSGEALQLLSRLFAKKLVDSEVKFEVLFGPAYKGISLVSSTTVSLVEYYGINVEYCYDRKEIKDHGEKGKLVGGPLNGKNVVIIDDVLTSGSATIESIELIKRYGGKIAGVVFLLDRQECSQKGEKISAAEKIARNYNVTVLSIICLQDIINFLEENGSAHNLVKILEHKKEWGPVAIMPPKNNNLFFKDRPTDDATKNRIQSSRLSRL